MSLRLKNIATLVTACAPGGARPFVSLEDVEGGTGKLAAAPNLPVIEPPQSGVASAEVGDVLFGKLRPYLAKTWLVDRSVYASTELMCLRANPSIKPRWFAYLCASTPLVQWAIATSDGTKMPRTSWENLGEFRLHLVPPLDVQQETANYLDRETARIDALIRAKRRMVELLDERWLGLMHDTTRGAFTPGPRRDSNVDWLGQVPSAWRVMSIKRLAVVRRGASPRPIDDPIYFDPDGEYAWVRIADVSASGAYLERTTQRLSTLGSSLSVKMMPGDLFLSIAGTVGKPIITRIKCCIHDGFVYFVGLKMNPKYLYYLFRAGQLYLGLGKMGTQLNLNTDTVGSIRVPVPELGEQAAIVARLDEADEQFTAARNTVNSQVAVLNERRQALITAAVTGQLDIPEAA